MRVEGLDKGFCWGKLRKIVSQEQSGGLPRQIPCLRNETPLVRADALAGDPGNGAPDTRNYSDLDHPPRLMEPRSIQDGLQMASSVI
jgi:hypothetical protein